MKKLIEKLGAFFIALAMILAVFPTQVQAEEAVVTWLDAGKASTIKGKDYQFIEDENHVVSEIQVMTATGLGFVSYLMTGKVYMYGVSYDDSKLANATIKLMNDIDLAGKQWVGIGGITVNDSGAPLATYVATTAGLIAGDDYFFRLEDYQMGPQRVNFKGKFDGNNKTISNLTIQRTYDPSGGESSKDDFGFMNFTSKKYDGSTGGYFMAENYFLFNNDSEFKNVTFKDINVQIIDKSTGNDLSEVPGGNGDDLLRGSAAAFGLIMENHGV
ncbi:MAG TPA: hypothetical protein DCM01_02685, partial [Dielma fastidiosa]|nr:hypothetical protein [Dielma fastidiosa]